MAKLDNTSGTVIAITFLVMNLATWWRRVFCVFLCLFGKRKRVFGWKIIYNYNWVQLIQKNLYLTPLSDIDRCCYWFAIDIFSKPYLADAKVIKFSFLSLAKSPHYEDGVNAVGASCEDLSGRPQHGRLFKFSLISNNDN
jgi:hypothetical protein